MTTELEKVRPLSFCAARAGPMSIEVGGDIPVSYVGAGHSPVSAVIGGFPGAGL